MAEQRTTRLGAVAASVYVAALLCRIWAWVVLAGLGFLVVMMAWLDAQMLQLGLLAAGERAVEQAASALTESSSVAQVFLVSALGACGCTAFEMAAFRRAERAMPVTATVFAGAGAAVALIALVSFREAAVRAVWTELAMYAGAGSQVLLVGAMVIGRVLPQTEQGSGTARTPFQQEIRR